MSERVSVRCDSAAPQPGGVKIFSFRLPLAASQLHAAIEPGRYVALEYGDMAGMVHQRTYSVTRKVAPDLFEIAVRPTGNRGVADSMYANLKEGAAVTALFAAGDITVDSILRHRQVFMWAGGIGVTLPVALLRELARLHDAGREVPRVTLFLCCPSIDEMAFMHELLHIDLSCDWMNVKVFITRKAIHSNSPHFHSGRPGYAALQALPKPDSVVLCGSHAFAEVTRRVVKDMFPEAQLLIESFSAPPPPGQEKATLPAQRDPHVSDTALEAVASTANVVRIAIAGRSAGLSADPAKSLLENLEAHDIPIRSQCRSGICGTCRLKIVSGECRRETDFCLNDKDIGDGFALACCTYPTAGPLIIALPAGT